MHGISVGRRAWAVSSCVTSKYAVFAKLLCRILSPQSSHIMQEYICVAKLGGKLLTECVGELRLPEDYVEE